MIFRSSQSQSTTFASVFVWILRNTYFVNRLLSSSHLSYLEIFLARTNLHYPNSNKFLLPGGKIIAFSPVYCRFILISQASKTCSLFLVIIWIRLRYDKLKSCYCALCRSSRPEVFLRKGVLKIGSKFTG